MKVNSCNGMMGLGLSIVLSLFVHTRAFAFENDRPLEAATLNYPPYEYLDDGEPRGLAVSIIQEAARRAGVTAVNFHFFPWKRAVAHTKKGTKDLLFNAGKNEERQEWGYYADSVLILQRYFLFARKGSNIVLDSDFDNAEDISIGIRRGYLYGSGTFRKAIDGGKFKRVFLTSSTEESVRMLLGKRTDLFVGDYLPVVYYLESEGLMDQVEMVKVSGTSENMVVLTWPTYLLFSKETVSPAFVQKMNRAMEEMKKDGTFSKITDQFTPEFP